MRHRRQWRALLGRTERPRRTSAEVLSASPPLLSGQSPADAAPAPPDKLRVVGAAKPVQTASWANSRAVVLGPGGACRACRLRHLKPQARWRSPVSAAPIPWHVQAPGKGSADVRQTCRPQRSWPRSGRPHQVPTTRGPSAPRSCLMPRARPQCEARLVFLAPIPRGKAGRCRDQILSMRTMVLRCPVSRRGRESDAIGSECGDHLGMFTSRRPRAANLCRAEALDVSAQMDLHL